MRHSMKEQIETRIAKLIEAVKRASLEDSSGRAQTGDALDRLVDAIEVVLLLVNAFEENTHDKIYFKDLQGRFIYVSKSYSMAFGGLIEHSERRFSTPLLQNMHRPRLKTTSKSFAPVSRLSTKSRKRRGWMAPPRGP